MSERGVELRSEGLGVAVPSGQFSVLGIHRGSGLVAVAGQMSRDVDGRLVGPDDAARQAEQALSNVAAVLGSVGLGWHDVLKLTTYVVGAENVDGFARGRARYWDEVLPGGPYPLNSLVVVSGLAHPGCLVEVEALAVRDPVAADKSG